MKNTSQNVQSLKEQLESKEKEATRELNNLGDALEAQNDIYQEQQRLEAVKANSEREMKEQRAQHSNMDSQAPALSKATLHKLDETKDCAKQAISKESEEMKPHRKKGIMDSIADAFNCRYNVFHSH